MKLWAEKWEIDSWGSKWEFAGWQIAAEVRICWLADCSRKSQNWLNGGKSNSETLLIMIWIKIRQNRWLLSTEKGPVWWWSEERRGREKGCWLRVRLLPPHFPLFSRCRSWNLRRGRQNYRWAGFPLCTWWAGIETHEGISNIRWNDPIRQYVI